MEEELRKLELKKARLFSEIQMLSTVSDLMYKNFGKVCADIMILKRKINLEIVDILKDN